MTSTLTFVGIAQSGEREHVPARIDPTSELWQELNRAARAGSQSAQEIVERRIAEDKEARRVVAA